MLKYNFSKYYIYFLLINVLYFNNLFDFFMKHLISFINKLILK